jgi:hypothetical protein
MKAYLLLFLLLFSSAVSKVEATIALSPVRTSQAATLLNSGKVLLSGGVNTDNTLNSALLYDPVGGTLVATGNMVNARADHTSTLLSDGRVLVTGGDLLSGKKLKSAEIYDPSTGLFTQVAKAMSIARTSHTATLLPDGRVLIVGGKTADLFDVASQTFTATANKPVNRKAHAALLLNNGTVLITGGYVGGLATTSAEIFNPATNTFTKLSSTMRTPRANHQTNLLPDGTVLATGGFSGTSPHDECDIYDPGAQTFTSTTPMNFHRSNHRGISTPDGRVLVIGGTTLESGFLATNEIFDPVTKVWTIESNVMAENRSGHTATLLGNGQVFVAGGVTGSLTIPSAEILDPASHAFTSLGNMIAPRNQHTDTLLPDGTVLLAGGSNNSFFLNSAEIFNPATNAFSAVGNFSLARKSHTATLLLDGEVLIAGGKTGDEGDTTSAQIYSPSTMSFRTTHPMNTKRSLHTATLLNDGTVLLAAGRHGGTPTPRCEIFDPTTELWTNTGSMNLQRKRHRAAKLADGTVLIAGGASLSNDEQPNSGTPTAEQFDPATGVWTSTQDMHFGRTEHEATFLPDGTVLESGGILLPNQADLYQPSTRSFTSAGTMVQDRSRHIAILLTNPAWGSLTNQVLIIGGSTTASAVFGGLNVALDSVEVYNPTTQQFSFFGTMTTPRQNHTATLLNDGRILITGGVGSPAISGTAELVVP